MFYRASMGTSSAHSTDKAWETPRRSVYKFEVPPFSTQDGLENISLDEVEEDATEIPKRLRFTMEKDNFLVESWLEIQ